MSNFSASPLADADAETLKYTDLPCRFGPPGEKP
jgi:hypothetical protein